MAKPIYKAASDFDFLWSMLLRLLGLAGIVYLSFHYKENPAVIITLSLVCLLFFLITGNDEIAVYKDQVICKDTSITSLFSKGRSYNIREIRSASIPGEARSTIDEIAAASVLLTILPKMRYMRRSPVTTINLELKNDKIIQISSSLDKDKMEKVADTINALI